MLAGTSSIYARLGILLALGGCVDLPVGSSPAEAEELDASVATLEESQALTGFCLPGWEPVAQDVRLRQLALYQAVKIPLVQDGIWQTARPAPIVQGKEALLRAFVEPLAARGQRALRGVLSIENGFSRTRLTADLTPTGPSSEGALSSTINFRIPASAIGASTRFSVTLVDPTCSDTRRNPNARFPASGTQALDTTRIGKLRIVLVPVIYNGIAPDTSQAQLAAMRADLLALYPVPGVELTIRAAITTTTYPQPSGTGWSELLDLVSNRRQADAPAADVYYYGLVNPAATFPLYCSAGCVTELAMFNSTPQPRHHVAVGIGFASAYTRSAMTHALGHVHGRRGSPCGGHAGVDPAFPYADGSIGSWGWDNRSNALLAPAVKDFRGYC